MTKITRRCKCGCGNIPRIDSDYCSGHEPVECNHDRCVKLYTSTEQETYELMCVECHEIIYVEPKCLYFPEPDEWNLK